MPGLVRMYTCGQTVYNDIHMGNARFYVVFDAVRRYLLHKGYDVRFVQNFTDVDDKIIEKANAEGVSVEEIAERYIRHALEDLKKLAVMPATVAPRATELIPEMIEMIKALIEKGFAYEVSGTVYYSVEKFKNYGLLSGRRLEEMEAGKRIAVEENKQNPMDFVLWKPAKENEPGWASPWGNGRPGWHIECSAMVNKYLGNSIDIHGGAEDLIFPHHENEIAQSEAVTGETFSRYWMHCGFITVDHKKMSKSRGNFTTLREVISLYPAEVIRFYLLSVHYRMPIEFGDVMLKAAQQGFERIKNCFRNLQSRRNKTISVAQDDFLDKHFSAFETAMDNDFNTADAVSAVFELVREINKVLMRDELSDESISKMQAALLKPMRILGFELEKEETTGSEVDDLIEKRQLARKNRDFAEADRIRNELAKMGIIIEDTAEGVRWRKI